MVSVFAFCEPGLGNHSRSQDSDEIDELWERPHASERFDTGLLRFWSDLGDRAGFEIGNGRKLIKNLAGQYKLKIYDEWDVGILGKFTRISSPQEEEERGARLRINVIPNQQIQQPEDMLDKEAAADWIPVVLDDMEGLQQHRYLPDGRQEVEMRLFRQPGEMILLKMDGTPGDKELSPFDRIQSSLMTFQSLN